MADSKNNKTLIWGVGAVLLVLLVLLFVFGGGHSGGPSAPSGEGNPTQNNLGR
jgi:hypothetical protein